MICNRKSRPWMLLVLVIVASALSARAAVRQPTPIVLDTDIGGDIDDAFALALVLKSPELELRAVTTVSGDTQARARLAAKMLAVAGRGEIPVAAGAPGAHMDAAQTRWADGFSGPALVSKSAVELMKSVLDRGHGQVVIVAIGPLSNVAALLRQFPDEKRKIRKIVLMGGSIRRGYYPNSGPTAEYNIAADAAASQTVFASGVPISMAPLDVTARLQLEQPNLEKLFSLHTPLTDALQALYKLWGQPVPTLHDPMAVAQLLDPQLCAHERLGVEITAAGMTIAAPDKPANADVAVTTEPTRFIGFYMSRVVR